MKLEVRTMLTSKKKSKKGDENSVPSKKWTLILHNDEVNSFDYVMDQLVSYCDHTAVQAEQCALITHFNGKCDILVGEMTKLELVKQQLQEKLLTVTIDG